jgi:hypothetical protein
MPPQKQKLYCYVDESGQDDASRVFVVVAVVSGGEQDELREALTTIENAATTNHLKWHKTSPKRRMKYLEPGTRTGPRPGGHLLRHIPEAAAIFLPVDGSSGTRDQSEGGAIVHRAGVCGRH